MPYIREWIVTTASRSGKVHIAPLGIIAEKDGWVIAPFRPSTTLDNLAEVPFAVANYTDDVRIFAGCLTGRKDWPTVPVKALRCRGCRRRSLIRVLEVVSIEDDGVRPRHFCRVRAGGNARALHRLQPRQGGGAGTRHPGQPAGHAAAREDRGGNRLSHHRHRKDRRPEEEREAWGWLMERVTDHFTGAEPRQS